ncbi:hypothetical protein KHQ81_06125 [Mycoplasmatota bacterium]|nr:hypothetical protein KHQ81_06125 [Mycoplasmatota bacterium]
MDSKVLSFYKGSLVVRQNQIGTCSIFGTVWLNDSEDKSTLKHEWGHSIQERILGPLYIPRIAIPSVINYYRNPSEKEYYSAPWERTADWFGGVNRSSGYNKGSLPLGILYLLI